LWTRALRVMQTEYYEKPPLVPGTTGRLRARHLYRGRGTDVFFVRGGGDRPRAGALIPASPQSLPAILPRREGHTASLETRSPSNSGGRRRPWTRRPPSSFSCQRASGGVESVRKSTPPRALAPALPRAGETRTGAKAARNPATFRPAGENGLPALRDGSTRRGNHLPESGDRPPFRGSRSPFGADRPSLWGDRPPFGADRPSLRGSRPPARGSRSPFGGNRSPSWGRRSPFWSNCPSLRGSRPPTRGSRSPFGGDRPSIRGDRRRAGADRPSSSLERIPEWLHIPRARTKPSSA